MAILNTKGGKAREKAAYQISGALLFSLAVLAVQRMRLGAAVDKSDFGVDSLLMEVCPRTIIVYAGWVVAMMSNIPGSPYLSWEPAHTRRPKIKNTSLRPWVLGYQEYQFDSHRHLLEVFIHGNSLTRRDPPPNRMRTPTFTEPRIVTQDGGFWLL